jgi:hypothetical protein
VVAEQDIIFKRVLRENQELAAGRFVASMGAPMVRGEVTFPETEVVAMEDPEVVACLVTGVEVEAVAPLLRAEPEEMFKTPDNASALTWEDLVAAEPVVMAAAAVAVIPAVPAAPTT